MEGAQASGGSHLKGRLRGSHLYVGIVQIKMSISNDEIFFFQLAKVSAPSLLTS